jgi:hypothetical protein
MSLALEREASRAGTGASKSREERPSIEDKSIVPDLRAHGCREKRIDLPGFAHFVPILRKSRPPASVLP